MPRRDHGTETAPYYDLRIDLGQLDRMWLEHPLMVHEAATGLANARRAEQEAKQELEAVKGDIMLDIMERPGAYDMPKVTVDSVNAKIPGVKRVREAQRAYNEAKHAADLLAATVSALEHRKRALQGLVDLHGMDYFSVPVARGDHASRAVREGTKAAVNERVRNRKRSKDQDNEEDDDD